MERVTKNTEQYFGRKCIAYAAKLELQERNTPHHHFLIWLEGGLLEDIDEVDDIICAELPRECEDDDLRQLVKKYNIHRHSPYCKRNNRCQFVYDENFVLQSTYIGETSNRVASRRREEEDLRVVPYNRQLSKQFKAHINVERTQGGAAVAYLMKYAFKPSKPTEVHIRTFEQVDPSYSG